MEVLEQFRSEKLNKSHGDPITAALILMLAGLGLCALFSISYQFSMGIYGEPLQLFKKQLLNFLVFGSAGFILSKIRLQALRPFIPYMVFGTLFLLVMPFFPSVGVKLNGGTRWISLGLFGTLQPSEVAKLVMILYLAHILDKKQDKNEDLVQGFLPPVLILSLFVLIIFLQRDLSTAVFVFSLGYMLLFLGGVRIFHLLGFLVPLILLSLVRIVIYPYSRYRLMTYLGILDDPQGAGYQIEASLNAFTRGGLFGRGLGANMINGSSVPQAHSDFIFSAMSEEVGFVGVGLFFILLALFCARGLYVAWKVRDDRFQFLTASGITFAITFQALVNIGVTSKLLPTTGIPLPFFSAGGSSLMVTMLMSGILIGISSYAREEQL